MSCEQLGRDVRIARLRAGYSQDGLAYLAGISARTVIRVEQGRMISLRTMFRILAVLEGPDINPLTVLSHYRQTS